jgi:hypothetical protein
MICRVLYEGRKDRRTALLTRTIARDAPHRLRLRHPSGMTHERSENGIGHRKRQKFGMRSDKSGGTVGALFSRSSKLRSRLSQIASVNRIPHAMMLPIAAAARRQPRRIRDPQREQRRDGGEA